MAEQRDHRTQPADPPACGAGRRAHRGKSLAESAAETQLADANSTIDELVDEGAVLAQEIAQLNVQTDTLTARAEARDQELEGTQSALADAERRAAQLATERETLSAQVAQRQQQLATDRGRARGRPRPNCRARGGDRSAPRASLLADPSRRLPPWLCGDHARSRGHRREGAHHVAERHARAADHGARVA